MSQIESKSSLAWEAVGEVMTAVLLHLNRPLMILVNPPEYLPYCLDSITILPEKKWTYFFVKPCHIMQMHTLYGKYGIFYRNIQKSQNTTNQYKSPGKRQHFLIGFQSAPGAQSEQTSLLQIFLSVQTGSVTKFLSSLDSVKYWHFT